MKRTFVTPVSFLFAITLVTFVSGCRAFNSDYSASPEVQEMLSKPIADPSVSKPSDDASPSDNAPVVDYSKDETVCETPEGVTVDVAAGTIIASSGWAATSEDASVSVAAVKKGDHSATVTIQKQDASKTTSTLTFTVKQTAASKFAACDFNYSEGEGRNYPNVTGSVMVQRVNAVDEAASSITNSGTFDLIFSRGDVATTAQSVYMGAIPAASLVGPAVAGTYFVGDTAESAE